ncbi:MAG TPA: hypothetical protein VM536_21730 [Chloroflexia bacterium]|nr:hypothetical protein [Chloroflexia bacterium]
MTPGYILAALLTLMVFSYLLGNNPLYRLVQHIFVGVSVGYATLLLLGNVLIPQLYDFAANPGGLAGWLVGLPLLLGAILLLRLRPATGVGGMALPAVLGSLVLNIAVSTAAALAIGGALTGTLVPQMADTMRPLAGAPADLIGNLIVVLGVVASLFYFQFSVRAGGTRAPAGALVASTGRWFIIIGLGAALGSLTGSFVSALVERVDFLFRFL